MVPGMPERRTHDYARHGIVNLFAAFNIADGTVITELHRQHRAVQFKSSSSPSTRPFPPQRLVGLKAGVAPRFTPAVLGVPAR